MARFTAPSASVAVFSLLSIIVSSAASEDVCSFHRTENDEDFRRVCLEGGTERAATGKYNTKHPSVVPQGLFRCACCGQALYPESTKFESGSGWPSFWAAVADNDHSALDQSNSKSYTGAAAPAAITLRDDYHPMIGHRTEVTCGRCGAHLGHVFGDAPQTPSGQRYCMNSVCLYFEDDASAVENTMAFDFVTRKSFTRVSNSTDLSAFKAPAPHVVRYQGMNWAVIDARAGVDPRQSGQRLNSYSNSQSELSQELWLMGLVGVFALTGTVLTITLRPLFQRPSADRRK